MPSRAEAGGARTADDRRLAIAWTARAEPLAPRAVAATSHRAYALGRRLLACSDAALSRLSGVAGPRLLIACGDEADLPWCDGVTYLGRDPDAPALLVPTTLRTVVHPALVAQALTSRRELAPPVAVLGEARLVASLATARPIERALLEAWLLEGPP